MVRRDTQSRLGTVEAIAATIARATESLALAEQYVKMLEGAGPLKRRQLWVVGRVREQLEEATSKFGWLSTVAQGDPQKPQVRAVVLEEEVRWAVDRAAAMAELADATILMTAAEPVSACADPEVLGRVLDNLLDNALTYSEGRPWIVVEIGSHPTPFIRVSDAGVGMTPEVGSHIFELSYRADPDNPGRPGSGIGLYFSRRAVEEMGGSLTLESAGLGSGSTFRLDLRPADGTAPGSLGRSEAASQRCAANQTNARLKEGLEEEADADRRLSASRCSHRRQGTCDLPEAR